MLQDYDFDDVPIEWEHKWGFNPLIWEDHENYDPDGDSLTNIEEYLTRDFGSDPFRKDIFIELVGLIKKLIKLLTKGLLMFLKIFGTLRPMQTLRKIIFAEIQR